MKNDKLTLENLQLIIEQQDQKIAKMEALIKYYEAQFLLSKRRQFGASSEQTEVDWHHTNSNLKY